MRSDSEEADLSYEASERPDLGTAAPLASLTVLGWPRDPPHELWREIRRLVAFGPTTPAAQVLPGGDRHLAWRGPLPGGVVTLYEHLGALLRAHGLDFLVADPRLEVFLPAQARPVVLGASRRPWRLTYEQFEEGLKRLDRGDDPAVVFAPRPQGPRVESMPASADDDGSARELPGEEENMLLGLAAPAPDLELLQGAETRLVERYDAEGLLEEAWVSRQALAWRTEVLAPGTSRIPGEEFDDSLCWRIAQWECTPDLSCAEGSDEGRWVLRAHAAMSATSVARVLPEPLRAWVAKATDDGIDLCQSLIEGGEPQFATAQAQLLDELDSLARSEGHDERRG